MSNKINSAFQEALQQLGRPTTPEDLRRRGVKRLHSVTTSEVSILIERAVNRTLMERTIGPLDPEQMADILTAAEDQFTRQLRDFEDLADSRQVVEAHRRETQAELTRLRESLEERQRGLQRPEPPSESEAELRQRLIWEIRACLQPLLPKGPLEGVGRRAVDDVQALTLRYVAEALEKQRRQFQLETENHERRVAKLVESLEQTEKVLARVAASKDLEQGIESMYRTVQGRSLGENGVEQKQELLVRIFEANVALRQALPPRAQFA
jgi:ferritin-like metal-binding protein YciE